ncbi:MAG TPA: hypothetical protein VMC43_01995 [Candidatus Paceibacterota bacterium]|nr:hypothetical protein [Candidatus Paceibacterota bacterium]
MADEHDVGILEEEKEVPPRSGTLAVWILPLMAPIGGLLTTGYLFQTCLSGKACLMYLYFWPYSILIGGMMWAAGMWYREKGSVAVYLMPIVATLLVLWYLWQFEQYFTGSTALHPF